MERKTLQVLSALLLVTLLIPGALWAQSTGKGDKEAKETKEPPKVEMSRARQKKEVMLEKQFVARSPSKEDLRAFETRVGQKVKELAEYLEIISDSSYLKDLRKRASEQAVKLFDRKDRKLSGIPMNAKSELEGRVSKVIDSLMERDDRLIRTEVEELRTGAFERTEAGHYEGDLSFTLLIEWKRSKGEEAFFRKELKMQGKGVLKKVPKSFGEEERMVWEVFLGSIEKKGA